MQPFNNQILKIVIMETTNNIREKTLLLIALFLSITIFAQTKLPSFFSNDMVLQRNENVAIWGHDKSGVQITVSGTWGETETVKTNNEGNWKLRLKTPDAGGPYMLEIQGSDKITLNNVLIGEVWLCSGQSNMWMPLKGYTNSGINGSNETILHSKNDQIRFFTTKRQASLEPLQDVTGKWWVAEPATVVDFSALAYYFGFKLNDILDVPIGLINNSWGGSKVEAWIDQESLKKFDGMKIVNELPKKGKNKSPSLLYNGMLHPFVPFTIKGILWYQGESNVSKAGDYQKLFSKMISSWREKWKQKELPFYFVQIAPFGYKGSNSAYLREAQMLTMQNIDNTGMVVTMDIGECEDVHPAEKELIGNRLAYWALANKYDIGGIAFSGPVYKSMKIDSEGKIILSFTYNANGLTSLGKPLSGFIIAGKDKIFHEAKAKINGDSTISVASDSVKKPVAVRYAFDNCTKGTLYNTEGLPASSFRTDDWIKK